jgi:hypothetical protein
MSWNASQFNENLADALESFDHDKARELCNKLVSHLRERDDPYPTDHSKTILGQLRSKRYFDLMQLVADTFIQNEQTDPKVLRQYAQSQLDQGNLTAAISTLKDLEKVTAQNGLKPNPEEHAEALGLLGRAYKDLYILAENPDRSRNRSFLENAIKYYRDIYIIDNSKIWQGINSVALIRRAYTDGVELKTIAGPKELADSMATEIIGVVKKRHLNKSADTWDFATGVEACVGLDKHEDALKWLSLYLNSQYTSAFELGSTYRQLTQVWKLDTSKPPGNKILPALKAALLREQGSEIEIGIKEASEENLNSLSKDAGYERILGTESFKSIKWFKKCMLRATAVAQVEDSFSDPVGTAFVIRGGDLKPELGDELLLLTNAHVISTEFRVSTALSPEKSTIKFELWKNSDSPEFKVKELWSSSPENLDATLLRPIPDIKGIEPIPITNVLPLLEDKQRAYIIGHPQGRKLSFSIHDNHLLDYDDRLLHYRSPTEPGNSGSPVFNDEWDLIGIHHRGLRKMPRLNNKDGTYAANEGIWIKAIIEDVKNTNIG